MKSVLTLIVFLMLISLNSKSQAQTNNFQCVKDAQEITWFGIDYSKNKLVGQPSDFNDLYAITQNYYGGINNLFLSEPQKYDLNRATGKKINFKIETALTNGTKVNTSNLVTVERQQLTEADIQEAIKQFKSDVSCVGMTMVMENFDKPMTMVRLHLVFFDPSTSQILFTHRYETKISGGFGFRNYYASGIYQTIKKITLDFPIWGQTTAQ